MSETTYFLLLNKQEAGPFTLAQIQAMVARGEIPPHTFYAAPGMSEWQHVSDLLATVSAAVPSPPPPPPRAAIATMPPADPATIIIEPVSKPAVSISRPAAPPPSLAPAPAPAPPPMTAPRRVPVTPLPPPPMAPTAAVEKSGGSRKKIIMAGAALVLVVAVAAAGWFLRPHTPGSSEPPPANVSYKKREKFSELRVTIPQTGLEKKIGRNLHRTAFQAATNLVAQHLQDQESPRFHPFKEAKIVGVEWRFRVQGRVETAKKSGDAKLSDYEVYLKRSADEEWTVEDLSVRKTTEPPSRENKASE